MSGRDLLRAHSYFQGGLAGRRKTRVIYYPCVDSRPENQFRVHFLLHPGPDLHASDHRYAAHGKRCSRLGRALETLIPCDEILIVDHHSRDATRRVARQYGARIVPAASGSLHQYLRLAAHDWILCLQPTESITERLQTTLYEWKSSALAKVPMHSAYSVFVREETATVGSIILRRKPASFRVTGPDGKGGFPPMSSPPLRWRENCCVFRSLERRLLTIRGHIFW